MRFHPGRLDGVCVIDIDRIEDDRGFFGRSFCAREFERAGLHMPVAQCNVSFNRRAGTLRGLHFQVSPHEEAKVVRCTAGVIFDVVVDLRGDSPTYLAWEAFTLSADNRSAVYVPAGFAHGFQSLADNSEVLYLMSEFYAPSHARGVPWDDPAIGIVWPLADPIISERDRSYTRVAR